MKKITSLLIVLSIVIALKAQDTTSNKIAILPFISNGIDPASVQTAESLFRMDLSKESAMDVISENKTLAALDGEDCNDEECAKEIGEKLNAKQVLICELNMLGEKIIVQYILVETSTGKSVLSERATSVSVEDLDAVMKRVALSVARQTPFDANQEVGNIVAKESVETLRQTARYNFGVGFGYLFPSEGYDTNKKSFTLNGYFDYEMMDFSAGLMLGARQGFVMNIYGNYLFSKTDICPYLGSSLGFHWVLREGMFEDDGKVGDGFELGVLGGIRIFHTYNFQLFIQGEYIMTFNDYNDKAFVLTIGIL